MIWHSKCHKTMKLTLQRTTPLQQSQLRMPSCLYSMNLSRELGWPTSVPKGFVPCYETRKNIEWICRISRQQSFLMAEGCVNFSSSQAIRHKGSRLIPMLAEFWDVFRKKLSLDYPLSEQETTSLKLIHLRSPLTGRSSNYSQKNWWIRRSI